MEHNSRQLINQAFDGSNKGELHFGQVLALLLRAGVESYAVDYRAHRSTYYLPGGEPVTLETEPAKEQVADDFDVAAVKAAIWGAQQGTVMYPEFKRLTMAAGCAGYIVWISGAHVDYFGRKGEMHVERFPD